MSTETPTDDHLGDDAPPDTPEAWMRRARAHLAGGSSKKAAKALRRAFWLGAAPAEVLDLYDGLDSDDLAPSLEASLLVPLAEALGDAPGPWLRLAQVQIARGQGDEAEAAARRLVALKPGSARAYRTLYLAVLGSARPERAIEVIRDALAAGGPYPDFPTIRTTLAGLGSEDRAALIDEMDAAWPEARLGAHLSEDATAENGSKEHRAYALALAGEAAAARALAAEVADKPGRQSPNRRELAPAVVDLLPGPGAWRRPPISDDGAEVVRSGPSTSGVTFLGFTGFGHNFSYPIGVIDAFCAAAGAASIFLRDYSYDLFLNGVAALAPDRAGTVEALREMLIALGTERLVVVGHSLGGFGALSYGRELGATEIHGMSALTSIGDGLDAPDMRARILTNRLARTFPPETHDLALSLPALPSRAPISLHYGAGHRGDAAQAENLSALEGVTLHPIEGHAHHSVVPRMIVDGRLQAWLAP